MTLHKKGSLPKKVSKLTFPLLENANEFIVHGFNYGVSPPACRILCKAERLSAMHVEHVLSSHTWT